jgi:hypothetical protein
LALEDPTKEAEIEELSVRTFRVENRVHEKWLKDKLLDDPMQWKDNDAPYELIFNLIRSKLRLDDGLRDRRMKQTTVGTLKLSQDDKKILAWHLNDHKALDHKIFAEIHDLDKRMARYYATRKRIYDETKICIYLRYSVQIKQLIHGLAKSLDFPGEFNPPAHLEPFMFSRLSADPAIRRLLGITNDVLVRGAAAVPALPAKKVKVASNRPERPSHFERGCADDCDEDDDTF